MMKSATSYAGYSKKANSECDGDFLVELQGRGLWERAFPIKLGRGFHLGRERLDELN